MGTYYIRRAGVVDGPWEMKRLLQEVRLKRLSRFHEISKNQHDWVTASNVPELFPVKELPFRDGSKSDSVGGDASKTKEAADPSIAEEVWFTEEYRNPIGPMTLDALKTRLCQDGLVSKSVWRFGWSEWVPWEQVPELAELSVKSIRNGVPPDMPLPNRESGNVSTIEDKENKTATSESTGTNDMTNPQPSNDQSISIWNPNVLLSVGLVVVLIVITIILLLFFGSNLE
ncbi:MAG: hypothetical protein Q8M16_07485 [Pirellulaceae bacterium]|nr:hypothetical protein [Pirellulaceae bacterium]